MGKKFIDADTLAKEIMQRVNNPAITNWLFAIINEILAADVEEVRHGKWKQENDIFTCSECGYQFEREGYTQFFNYCPNCGAKMDTESEE